MTACDCCGFATQDPIDCERAGVRCFDCAENCDQSCAGQQSESEREASFEEVSE